MSAILVVDDDPGVRSSLRRALQLEGFEVHEAGDGRSAMQSVQERPIDVIVLDWMMPGMSGIEVCKRVHETSDAAVLMLTARDTSKDRVEGLDTGADDYLVKPYDLDELLARIRALLRRRGSDEEEHVLTTCGIKLDEKTRTVTRNGEKVELTPREYELLRHFMRREGEVLSRQHLLSIIWNYPNDSNVLDVYVGYLRTKLGEPRIIHNMRGYGYVLRCDENTA